MAKQTKVIKEDAYFVNLSTGGRPKKVLNEAGIKLIEDLAQIMCTEEEIAGCLRVSVDTLHNEDNSLLFRTALEKGRANGKESLRREQWKCAKKGNPRMLIWLGKQYLGQTEKIIEAKADYETFEDLKKLLMD